MNGWFGDGREERMDALDLEMKLRRDPEVTKRRKIYENAYRLARNEAIKIGNSKAIDRLVAYNPAYIREMLETEDQRFDDGAIANRYARTFYKNFKEPSDGPS